jgi:hypothetical protein
MGRCLSYRDKRCTLAAFCLNKDKKDETKCTTDGETTCRLEAKQRQEKKPFYFKGRY